jgi:hypothetical protein
MTNQLSNPVTVMLYKPSMLKLITMKLASRRHCPHPNTVVLPTVVTTVVTTAVTTALALARISVCGESTDFENQFLLTCFHVST